MMNQQPPLQGMANQMAQYGRYGDSMLVHMNPAEVQGIAALSPTGSLTTNPVTGQPEAFLPFLAPLLGSALGSTFLTGSTLGGLLGTGLSSGVAGAIGSGLATTAATGDLKKGIISGLTGYGVGKALGAASDVASGADVTQQALDTTTELATEAAADYTSQAANLNAMSAAAGQPGSMIDPVADIAQAGSQTADALARSNALAGQQSALESQLASQRAGQTAMERAAAPFANPGTFGKALIKPANLAAIGVGEGQRGAMEMEERFARDAERFDREREAELERARQGLRSAYGQLESDYPGYKIPGYQAGGITSVNPNNYMSNLRGLQALAGGGRTVQNFKRGGRAEYDEYMGPMPVFGAGTAAQRQANIRGSQVISPEQLQGYRPGFGPEINYFQRPTATPAPTPGPGIPPGTTPPGTTPPDTAPPGLPPGTNPGMPNKGGGLGDFDYSQFAESETGREAIGNFRDLMGLTDVTDRLSAIEARPDPTVPQIDYDEITSRVRSGIDIPEFDLSGIETRLGAIEGREMPSIDLSGIESRLGAIEGREMPSIDYDAITSRVREGIDIPEYTAPVFDYDEIANRVRGSIDIPAVDLSGIESRLGAIEGREMPTVDLSGIESRLGAIESRPDPTFDTSGIMSAIDANREAIAGLPAPAPAFDSSSIMDAIAANREAIANMPAPAPAVDLSSIQSRLDSIESRPDPTFDTSGIMDAIAANRDAIAGMPAPQAFDDSSILAAIEANRKAIGGINSGGINPNPMANIRTKQASKRGFAEGGETEASADQGSRIIDLTIAAVMGQLPEDQAESVINRFVDEFGSEAFAILRRQVLQGNVPGAQTEGKISGNGGGMDDKVPGMIGDQQPVAVSPGEFIVPADVVSGLGDGSTDAGVEELYGMMDRVRSERTGMKEQPRPVNKAKVMPV